MPGQSVVSRPPRNWIYLWTVAVFVTSILLARWLGVRFDDSGLQFLYQYLDPEILRNDLLRGLYFLHAQPPLFNLFLGIVLKLFPDHTTQVFAVSFVVFALAMLVGLVWLMRALGAPDFIVATSCLLFALHPNFMVYSHWLFYTLPVALVIVWMTAVLTRYLDTGKAVLAHVFCWLAAVLMLTRALYHPLWFVAAIGIVAAFLVPKHRRELLVAAVVPLLLVNGLYLKNYLQVGTYSGSSWLGMNLSKRWPLSQNEMAALREQGVLPSVWYRRPFREPSELEHLGYFEPLPGLHPALGEPYKSNGEPNFNHRDYAIISKEMERANIQLIARYPGRYVQRSTTAFLLFLQPGPNSVDFLVDYDFSGIHRLQHFLTGTVFRGGSIERPIGMLEPPVNAWVLVFPVLLVFALYRAVRGDPSRQPDSRPVFAFMLLTVVWVTLASNLIEIGENDRMRWEVEPLLMTFLATAATAVYRGVTSFAVAEKA